jgi:putative sigma-54 modulation protein
MTVTIKGTNLDLTPALKRYATDKVLGLGKFFPTITLAAIELERTTRHHQKGEIWRAEANLRATGHLFRAEAAAGDIYAAVDALKDELKRELKALHERRALDVRRARRAKLAGR